MNDLTGEPVYLDHAATTPMVPAAIEAMTRHLSDVGNPSSLHASGRRARRVVEEARETIALALNCRPGDVVFTSGGTEADNLALKGTFWSRREADPRRTRILSTAVEHHAVLDPLIWLAEEIGAEVELLPVDEQGRLELDALRAAIDARPRERRPGLGDVGQQRGRHPPADRRGGRARGPARHPGAHRRGPGGGRGAGRLLGDRRRPDDADRAQGRWAVRGRRPPRTSRARGHRDAARRRPGARHPFRHARRAGDRRLRGRGRGGGQGPARARGADGRPARPAGPRGAAGGARRDRQRPPDRAAARQRPPALPRLRRRLAADAARRPRHRVLDRVGVLGRASPSPPTC